MEACATSLFGEPELSRLMGVVLRATYWALLSAVCESCSCLTREGGVVDDLLIVTCIHSGLSSVAPVQLLDCVFCIVEVFSGVPEPVMFW